MISLSTVADSDSRSCAVSAHAGMAPSKRTIIDVVVNRCFEYVGRMSSSSPEHGQTRRDWTLARWSCDCCNQRAGLLGCFSF